MPASVTIRMYNQNNLGDCFLLRFKDGGEDCYILIDFGSYKGTNTEREIEIAESILKDVGAKPLTVVLTHQHKDHLSGFIQAAETVKKLNINELWFSYLDDPIGKEAKNMRAVTEEFWNKNKKMKEKAKAKFGGVPAVDKMLEAKENIDLFGEEQTGGKAITNLMGWSKKNPEFLLPGKCFSLPRLPKNSVKVYVLGPPTDEKLLRKLNPSEGEGVHHLDTMAGLMDLDTSSNLMVDALDAVSPGEDSAITENFPFNKKYSHPLNDDTKSLLIKQHYIKPEESWRRIDHEWLSEMGRVSLHMSNLTNNSSLVLAFELVEKQKVLLFAADAQIGNWKSWLDVKFKKSKVDAVDLLNRTVFYKSGHHSSHNATLASSLDLMNEKELVIMIPVNEEVSSRMGFAMLQQGMLKGYNRKCEGRVLRSDTIFHTTKTPGVFKNSFASKEDDFTPAIKVVMDAKNESHLYIEYIVE